MVDRQADQRGDLDVGDVVTEPPAVGIAVELRRTAGRARESREAAGTCEVAHQATPVHLVGRRARDRRVEPQLVHGLARVALAEGQIERCLRVVRVLEAAEQDRGEIRAPGLLSQTRRAGRRRGRTEHPGQERLQEQAVQRVDELTRLVLVGVVLLELVVLVRTDRVPVVLQAARDDHLVDERLTEALDLHPVLRRRPRGVLLGLLRGRAALRQRAGVALAGDHAIHRCPAADDRLLVGLADLVERHLDGDRMHVEAGQVVGALAADADQVEDPPDVDRERILTRPDVDARAVGERGDRLLAHGLVVRERVLADVVGRRGALADLHARAIALLAPQRPGLTDAEVRVVDRVDRPDVVEERPRIGGRGLRPQRPGALGLAVAVPVDVEAVARRVVEVVVVRPLGRRFQRDDVRDHRHRSGLLGAREQIEVGEVCGRVVRDQRSLAVARGHRLARPARCERNGSQRQRCRAGRNARRNGGTHTHCGVPPCSDVCRRAPPASCRASFGRARQAGSGKREQFPIGRNSA